MAEQTFHCEHGHIWVGNDSKCPLHGTLAMEVPRVAKKSKQQQAEPHPAVKVQQLRCERGEHHWTRPAQRGKPPKNCPEHQPPKLEPSGRKTSGGGHKVAGRPRVQTLAELQQRYPNMDDESARIFAYVEQEFLRTPNWPGWRESGDIDALSQAYHARLRFVARTRTRAVPVLEEA